MLYDTIVDMNANTTLQNFIVTREGEVDRLYQQELTREYKTSPLLEMRQWASLQTEMFIYDLLHGTNYRITRNRLLREQRNRRFEERLGLQRTSK